MKTIKYPTYADVMWLYDRVIEASGGGLRGFRDEGELLYVLDFVQNDMYFPDFLSKMTFLIHRICHGHIFLDGNKRMGLAIGGLFLSINGIYKPSLDYEDLLKNLLVDIIAGKDYNENLKLELYKAVLD